jgi:hypothetical protein
VEEFKKGQSYSDVSLFSQATIAKSTHLDSQLFANCQLAVTVQLPKSDVPRALVSQKNCWPKINFAITYLLLTSLLGTPTEISAMVAPVDTNFFVRNWDLSRSKIAQFE